MPTTKSILLCREDPGKLPVIQSRHRTERAAFQSVRGRRFDSLRKSGTSFFVPCLPAGETFNPKEWSTKKSC